MHRLAQAAGAARQHEAAQAPRQRRDPGQGGVAAGAVDQGGPQHGGGDAVARGGVEQQGFGLAQATGEVALAGIGRVLLDVHAGRAEGDDPRRLDIARGQPAREAVQRSATEHRVHRPRQRRQRVEFPAQPVQAVGVRLRLPRQRQHPPAGRAQALDQRRADLAAGAEHQGGAGGGLHRHRIAAGSG